MTLYVVPLQTIVPWLPLTGSADAGAASRRIASSATPVASARPNAIESSPLSRRSPKLRHNHPAGQVGKGASRSLACARVPPLRCTHKERCPPSKYLLSVARSRPVLRSRRTSGSSASMGRSALDRRDGPVLGRDRRGGPADRRLHDLRITRDARRDGSVRARFWYAEG